LFSDGNGSYNNNNNIDRPWNVVYEGVRKKLEMMMPYKAVWREAIQIMSRNENIKETLKMSFSTSSELCHVAKQSSMDMNWYSKRLALMAIISAISKNEFI